MENHPKIIPFTSSHLEHCGTDLPTSQVFYQFYNAEQHEFLFASLVDIALQNGAHSSRKEFALRGANSLL